MLRPMANLFAVADSDPGFLDQIEERVSENGEFECVWRPVPGWLAARATFNDVAGSDREPGGKTIDQ